MIQGGDWKTLLRTTGLLLLVVAIFGIGFGVSVPQAEAAHCGALITHPGGSEFPCPGDTGGSPAPGASLCYNAFGDTYLCGSDPGDGTVTTPGGSTVTSAPNPQDPNTARESTPSGSMGAIMGNLWNFVASLLYIFLVAIPVYIASLAGVLFNSTILYLVVGMGQLINTTTGIGTAINDLWVVIRDVMNILFIFGLIYIGLKTIWNAEDSNTRKTLGLLIAAALLINFSLFISKAIIDFTNIAAVEICDLMNCRTGASAGIGNLQYSGISGSFFDATGVANLVTQAQVDANTSFFSQAVNQALTMFMVFILFVVLTIVFVGGAVMLFTRFVALILYMIFSPVMFLGWILPSFKKYSSDWWNGFFQKAFFAPLFLFMLYISLITVRQMRAGMPGTQGGAADYNGALSSGGSDAFNIILVYGFAIGMLVASIVVAKQFSMVGAGMTMGGLNGVRAMAYRMTGGAASELYRKGIDRLDAAAQRSDEQGGSRLRRNLARVGRTTITAPVGGTMNARRLAERGEKYGAGGTSRADVRSFNEQRASRASSANAVAALQTAFGQVNDANPTIRDAARERVRTATNKQLTELAKTSTGRDMLLNNAGLLTKDHIKHLRNSTDEHITEDFKNQLRNNNEVQSRSTNIEDLTGRGTNGELADIRNATKDQLSSLGFNTLVEPRNAARLTKKNLDHLNELRGDGELTPDQVQRIKDARRDAHLQIAAGNGNQINSSMTRNDLLANAEATAELHEDVIVALGSSLTSTHIRQIAKKVDTSHHQRIRQVYERNGVPPQEPAQRGNDGQYVANTPGEQKWMFLHRDPEGSTFGTS